jgi:hypothetical protein
LEQSRDAKLCHIHGRLKMEMTDDSRCIEGEGGELLVTKNCEAALRRLRDKDGEAYLMD